MLKKLLFVSLILSTPLFAKQETDNNFTILRETSQVISVFKQCSRMTPSFITSYSRLDEKLVDKLETMLPGALEKFAPEKTINLNDYYRQYVSFGMLRREGVYINAIHKESAAKWAEGEPERQELLKNWRTQTVNICGGKGLHWGAIYDGSGDAISEILFNNAIKPK